MRNDPQNSATGAVRERRTLKVGEWPEADRLAWEAACKRSNRLKKGGSASYLKPISQEDYARRYGLFLGFLKLRGTLDLNAPAATHVNPENIKLYLDELSSRVRSVTAWNSVSMVRRAAQFIAPTKDFSWLREIDNDLALVMQPKSKLDRFVLGERLVEAGLKLVDGAKQFTRAKFKRARAIRNGLMLALWTLCPSRRKNFATLEIGKTFRQVNGKWWITIPANETKTRQRPEERPVAEWLNTYIELYLKEARPILLTESKQETNALWISDKTRGPMTAHTLSKLIPQITSETIGVAISPHLFRTADATTAAEAKGDMPHLASALLGHTHWQNTEDYIRASSLSAANEYAEIVQKRYGARKPIVGARTD
jgi:site-specific recombinase XerD